MSSDFNEALRLSFMLHDVARLRRVALDRMLKPLGVTRSQWSVLTFLAQRDGMTQTALAAGLDLTKVSVGALLERMEAVELVQRRPDEMDGRIRRVFLTRTGSRLVVEIRDTMEKFDQEVLASISKEEFTTTFRTLERLKTSLVPIVYEQREDPGTKRRNVAFDHRAGEPPEDGPPSPRRRDRHPAAQKNGARRKRAAGSE